MPKNKKIKIILVSLAISFALIFTVLINSVVGADGAAGSNDDPLVTLSYVTKALEEMRQKIQSAMQDSIQEAVNKALQDSPAQSSVQAVQPQTERSSDHQSTGGSASYEVVELTKNQKIRAKSGTLELILRPGGEARIMSEFAALGLADITSGNELLHGDAAPINHALLVPRPDSRGLVVTSGIAYIMARGDYEIYE